MSERSFKGYTRNEKDTRMNLHAKILHLLSKIDPKQVNADATDQIKKTIKVYMSYMKDEQTDEHNQDKDG